MLRLLIGLTVVAAVLATPALAQKGGRGNQGPTPEEIDKKRQEQELDARYHSALKRGSQDSAPTRVDPWANAREVTTTKR